MNYRDITGARSGTLVASRYMGKDNRGNALWECKCDCGNLKTIRADRIVGARVKSCGCLGTSNFIDLTGIKFGRLIALKPIKIEAGNYYSWECKCDCGEVVVVRGDHLREGKSKSCGCYKAVKMKQARTHGESNTRLYNIWRGMKQRCNNPNHRDFNRYGKRGITVCEEWERDYTKFRDWALSNNYSNTLSLDRINNDGNYKPDNCRWATQKIQANNRTNSIPYMLARRFR